MTFSKEDKDHKNKIPEIITLDDFLPVDFEKPLQNLITVNCPDLAEIFLKEANESDKKQQFPLIFSK